MVLSTGGREGGREGGLIGYLLTYIYGRPATHFRLGGICGSYIRTDGASVSIYS